MSEPPPSHVLSTAGAESEASGAAASEELGDIVPNGLPFPSASPPSSSSLYISARSKPYWTGRQVVDGEKGDHQCPLCGVAFTRKFNLKSHIQTHFPERPKIKCDLCHLTFYRGGDLSRHRRTHFVGHKAFVCAACGKDFARSDRMRAHVEGGKCPGAPNPEAEGVIKTEAVVEHAPPNLGFLPVSSHPAGIDDLSSGAQRSRTWSLSSARFDDEYGGAAAPAAAEPSLYTHEALRAPSSIYQASNAGTELHSQSPPVLTSQSLQAQVSDARPWQSYGNDEARRQHWPARGPQDVPTPISTPFTTGAPPAADEGECTPRVARHHGRPSGLAGYEWRPFPGFDELPSAMGAAGPESTPSWPPAAFNAVLSGHPVMYNEGVDLQVAAAERWQFSGPQARGNAYPPPPPLVYPPAYPWGAYAHYPPPAWWGGRAAWPGYREPAWPWPPPPGPMYPAPTGAWGNGYPQIPAVDTSNAWQEANGVDIRGADAEPGRRQASDGGEGEPGGCSTDAA